MPRYLCSSCHEVVELSGSMRYDWCSSCGEPLSVENMLPVLLSPPRAGQASKGSVGSGAEVAAPALAATTKATAESSRPPRVSPPTT
jgi:predicted amidophosphoribosyltransferase